MAQALTFDDSKTIYLNTLDVPSPETPTSVVVEFLAAPINPIDHLFLADGYLIKPQTYISDLPVPGCDGVARVLAVGPHVLSLKIGDHVVVKRHGLGTWRTHAAVDAADLLSVNAELDPTLAAILRMGAAPAYYLLDENAASLRVGDWIVHTAATGVIAHFITQLAKLRGSKVMAVIRDVSGGAGDLSNGASAHSFESVARQLRAHGADAVVSEADLARGRAAPVFADKRIKLALDAVGGTVGEALIGVCSPGATFVTYGFLSGTPKTPMAITPAMTWASELSFKGFRLSKAMARSSDVEQQDLLDWLASMLVQGKLTAPRLERVVWERNGANVLERLREALAHDADKKRTRKNKSVIVFQ